MRVQASSFDDHVTLIWGRPEAITPSKEGVYGIFVFVHLV